MASSAATTRPLSLPATSGPALAAFVAATASHLLPSAVAGLSATCRAYRAELRPLLLALRTDLSGGAELHPVPLLGPCGGPTEQPDFLYLRTSAGCDGRMRHRLSLVEAAPCACAPGACAAGSCACIGAGSEAFDEEGRLRYLLEDSPAWVEPPIVECSARCACCAPSDVPSTVPSRGGSLNSDRSPTDTSRGVWERATWGRTRREPTHEEDVVEDSRGCRNVERSPTDASLEKDAIEPSRSVLDACTGGCVNSPTARGLRIRLGVFATRGRGYGLRTLQRVHRGTFVCEYAGEYVSSAQAAARRAARGDRANYAVCVREHVSGGRVLRTWIDPTVSHGHSPPPGLASEDYAGLPPFPPGIGTGALVVEVRERLGPCC